MWGVEVPAEELLRREFLMGREGVREGTKQSTITVLRGLEWAALEVVKKLIGIAVEVSELTAMASSMGEWSEQNMKDKDKNMEVDKRSKKEEKALFKILDELDRKDWQKSKVKNISTKRDTRVPKVPQNQPKMTLFLVKKDKPGTFSKLDSKPCFDTKLRRNDLGVQVHERTILYQQEGDISGGANVVTVQVDGELA